MKKLFAGFLFLLIRLHASGQQDAQFSQYIFNGLYINPAYAGYKEQIYTQLFYRAQWTGVEGAPQTLAASIDGVASKNKNIGLGLLVSHDKLGAQTNIATYANYAFRLRLGRPSSRLAFGLGVGAVQVGIDGSKLRPGQLGDQFVPVSYQATILPDARAGIFYSNERFFVGVSANNLLAQYTPSAKNNTIYGSIPKIHSYLTAGVIFHTSENIAFKPSILLKDDQTGPTSLDLDLFLLFKERFWLGGFYRSSVKLYEKKYLPEQLQKSNAMGVITEYFVSERLRFGYSFDYSLNKLQNYNYGSHELSLGFYFSLRDKNAPKCYF